VSYKPRFNLYLWAWVLIMVLAPTGVHACRLYGVISGSLPEGVLKGHLLANPFSLEELSLMTNVDGWGIGYVPQGSTSAVLARGAVRAYKDPLFENTVLALDTMKPRILLAHIRRCVTGCCAHGEDAIEDPHPFYRIQDGKQWFFIHNGVVDIPRMRELIGEEYLAANPPNGSGVPECVDQVVDSELFFLYLLKSIQKDNGDVVRGISDAVASMVKSGEKGTMNFILSDGQAMWAFRRCTMETLTDLFTHTLYYLYDRRKGFTAVASQYPSLLKDGWIAFDNYDLLVMGTNSPPVKINIRPGR
jgi:predicted glutamine amidotransferase